MKKLMKLLIGYDGSACADACLSDLRRAGLPRKANAVVLTVSEFWLAHGVANANTHNSIQMAPQVQGLTSSSARTMTDARALAFEGKKQLQTHFPAWEIEAEDSSGSPAREILKKAKAWGPDLIVVGCQGRSALGRFLLGSVSQKVVNEARCSVRVARGTAWKNGSPVRILVGFDGSVGAIGAIDAISMRMWPPASEVRLITIIDSPTGSFGSPLSETFRKDLSSSPARIPIWIQESLKTAIEKLRGADLIVSSKCEEGDPKQLIVANAEEWGAECIFVGASFAERQFEQLLLGSVATAVVSRAHCSVEVVRQAPVSGS